MLFRSRETPSLAERIRLAVWPRVSWSRSLRYYRARVVRLSGSAHAIALGFGIGVTAAFSPFVGFHIFIALGAAWLFRANLISTALGTAIANPITLPFIWASTYEVGRTILGHDRHGGADDIGLSFASRSFDELLPLIRTMLVGWVPVGLMAGSIAYLVAYQAVRAYRSMRAARPAAAAPNAGGSGAARTAEKG